MAFLNGYTNRIRLTIDHTKVGETLTNFPVRVSLTSANLNFANANSDGFDFRFTSSDGYTLLKYERELHDSANSLAEYWVKIPSVSSSVDTVFFLYYRTTDTADGADPENVWNSNYGMVQHLKDNTTSSTLDSTANNNDGTKHGANSPTQSDCKIAQGQTFVAANTDYIDMADSTTVKPASLMTMSAIVYKTDYSVAQHIMSKRTGNYGYVLQIANGNRAYAYVGLNGVLTPCAGKNNTLTNSNWYHISATYDGHYIRLYVNGVYNNSSALTEDATIDYDTSHLRIGSSVTSGNLYDGKIDEVRISNDAKSVHWLLADYHSCFDTLLTKTSESLSTVFIAVGGAWKEAETVIAKMS